MSRRLIHLFFLCLISIVSLAQNKIALPTGKLITLDKATIGLSNVDNTSDVNKPISTPTKDYLDAKSLNIGTSSIPFNRASGALSLSGVSIDGTAKNISDFPINQALSSTSSPTFSNLTINGNITQQNVKSALVKTDASGKLVPASAGTDYVTPAGEIYSASNVKVSDTRDSAFLPSKFPMGVRFDFKTNAAINLDVAGTYAGVMTFRKWGYGADYTGGSSMQLAYSESGPLYRRYGNTSSNVWSSWNRILDTDPTITNEISNLTLRKDVNAYDPLLIMRNDVRGTSSRATLYARSDSTVAHFGALNSAWAADGRFLPKEAYVYSTQGLSFVAEEPIRFGVGSSESLRISKEGNVGIGTLVSSGSATSRSLAMNGSNSSTIYLLANNAYNLNISANGTSTEYNSYKRMNFTTLSTDPIGFATNGTVKMLITANGDVGIGTITPYTPGYSTARSLTINGISESTLNLYANNVGGATLYTSSAGSILSEPRNLPLSFNVNSSEQMRITSNGNVGIGTNASSFSNLLKTLSIEGVNGCNILTKVNGNDAFVITSGLYGTNIMEQRSAGLYLGNNGTQRLVISQTGAVSILILGTGTVYSNGGMLTNTNPSDSTLKNTIRPLNYGLSQVMQLRPKSFYYNSDTLKTTLKYGFIAQEVQNVLPELVHTISKESDKLGIDSEGINVTLVQAVQELKQEVDEKKARIEALEARISVLNKMEERLLALETYMKNQ